MVLWFNPVDKGYILLLYFNMFTCILIYILSILENVRFSYDPRNEALKDISFRIPKGKTVALVGPSGGG